MRCTLWRKTPARRRREGRPRSAVPITVPGEGKVRGEAAARQGEEPGPVLELDPTAHAARVEDDAGAAEADQGPDPLVAEVVDGGLEGPAIDGGARLRETLPLQGRQRLLVDVPEELGDGRIWQEVADGQGVALLGYTRKGGGGDDLRLFTRGVKRKGRHTKRGREAAPRRWRTVAGRLRSRQRCIKRCVSVFVSNNSD